jgi:peroxiredoxin
MAATPSNMIPLGTKAPDFTLPDTVSDNILSLDMLKGEKATVIMFISNHCPYVKHLNNQLAAIAKDYKQKSIAFIAISSNDVENYPADAPDKMKETATVEGYTFPYLYDESQQVAKDYDAACTPDFYVFNNELRLVYRGQFDDSRPSNGIMPSGKDLCNALDAILSNNEISPAQSPSIGCNIKWKK